MKAATKTTLLILIVLAIITLPQASATNTCTIRPAGTCQAGVEVAIASTSAAGNAHAAPPASFPGFGHELCCTETINEPYYGIEPMFTIADDGGQGHVAAPTYFPQDISGSWTQCEIRNSCRSDQACLVDISDATQGHISTCGESTISQFNQSICCCPFGTIYDSDEGQCFARSSDFEVTVTSGPTTAPASTPTYYDIRFEWGPDFGVNYEMFFREQGSTVRQAPFSVASSDLNGDVTLTYEAIFPSDGDYEVCGWIQDQTNTSRTREHCRDVTVQDDSLVASLTGDTSAQVGDEETYQATITWGDNAGGITGDFSVTYDGTTTPLSSFSAGGDSGVATEPQSITFTNVGLHRICVEARQDNYPLIEDESCVDVNVAASDFVDVTGLSGPQNNLSISTFYNYDADVSWSGGDVDYLFFIRKVFNTTLINQNAGTLSGFSGTNQPVSWCTQYPEAGAYYLNLTADNTQAQDSQQLYVTVGEQLTNATQCQDLNPDYNDYACINNSESPFTDGGRYVFDSVSSDYFCAGNEDAYCRTCGDGFTWNASESKCLKDTCESGDELLYDECSAPDPLLVDLQANVTSGPAHLSVFFDINITGAIDGVTYELDFDDGTPYIHTGWDPVTDDTTHTYERPKTQGINNILPYEATLTATDGEERTNSSTVFINVTCIGSGYSGNPNLCCDGLIHGKGACWAPGQIHGVVQVNYSDGGILLPQSDNEVVVRIYNDTDEVNSTAVGTNGRYAFNDLIPGDYTVRASRPLSEQNESITLGPGGNIEQNFILQDPVYNSDCTNAQGRCDSNALGRNGCLIDPTDPEYDNRSQVLFACDRRLPGSQVTIDQNGTHSLVI